MSPLERDVKEAVLLRNTLYKLNHGGGKDEAENMEKLIESRRCFRKLRSRMFRLDFKRRKEKV